jgi:hypothetical protein
MDPKRDIFSLMKRVASLVLFFYEILKRDKD